jgi:hypothetical protein
LKYSFLYELLSLALHMLWLLTLFFEITFNWDNSLNPTNPSSRPIPDCL